MDTKDQFTVILVDDYAAIRTSLRKALEDTGVFRVVGEAEDGQEAIELVREFQPDVLMLDLSMPNRGGLDVLPTLRQEAPSCLVAVLSSIGPDIMGKAVWRSGADLYLEKASGMKHVVAELLTEIQVREAMGTQE